MQIKNTAQPGDIFDNDFIIFHYCGTIKKEVFMMTTEDFAKISYQSSVFFLMIFTFFILWIDFIGPVNIEPFFGLWVIVSSLVFIYRAIVSSQKFQKITH